MDLVSELAEGQTEDILNTAESAVGQMEMPFAFVNGEAVTKLPQDLYIPPDALEVFLDAFEGPLDLLLYLIKRQNLDILNVKIAEITRQYVEYVELMTDMRLELAGEYLVMAAMLAEIKSRMLLPRPVESDDEEDPRAELIRRLQEYERYKAAAEDVDKLPRIGRDVFQVTVEATECRSVKLLPDVDLKELLAAMIDIVSRADLFTNHQIRRETLSVRERMTKTLSRLSADTFTEIKELINIDEGKLGVVVTFLAILELVKGSMIDIVQHEEFSPIYIQLKN